MYGDTPGRFEFMFKVSLNIWFFWFPCWVSVITIIHYMFPQSFVSMNHNVGKQNKNITAPPSSKNHAAFFKVPHNTLIKESHQPLQRTPWLLTLYIHDTLFEGWSSIDWKWKLMGDSVLPETWSTFNANDFFSSLANSLLYCDGWTDKACTCVT